MNVGRGKSLPSVCLHTQQICVLATLMKYLVKAVKERIRDRKQPHTISQSRGAQEMDRHHEAGAEAHGRSCTWKHGRSIYTLAWMLITCFWQGKHMPCLLFLCKTPALCGGGGKKKTGDFKALGCTSCVVAEGLLQP